MVVDLEVKVKTSLMADDLSDVIGTALQEAISPGKLGSVFVDVSSLVVQDPGEGKVPEKYTANSAIMDQVTVVSIHVTTTAKYYFSQGTCT